ncbi:MAG TPA: prepilin-type N-terminal cleavage/methylation domain-containing protein [Stellaceae bacterium]|nr:prepilin-type N-terminal cleavage/methylation domain-containing protein [Stellaceae bacterium]
MPSSFGDRPAAGFSLIEVLFALAVVGIALGTAASVFGNGVLGYAVSRDVDTALAVAQEQIAAAGVTAPLQPGTTEGVFAGRFAWHLAVARFDDRAAPAPPAPFGLYRIDASVTWREGPRQREIALSTLRLVEAPP